MNTNNRCVECGEVLVGNKIICRNCLEQWCLELKDYTLKVSKEKKELQEKLVRATNMVEHLLDVVAENQRYIIELRAQKNKVILSLN